MSRMMKRKGLSAATLDDDFPPTMRIMTSEEEWN